MPDSSLEQLFSALTARLALEHEQAVQQFAQVEAARETLREEKRQQMAKLTEAKAQHLAEVGAAKRKLEEEKRLHLALVEAAKAQQLAEVEAAKQKVEEEKRQLEEMRQRILGVVGCADDVIELNAGGQPLSTTRKVLCSAEGSILEGMFSGNLDSSFKRDREDRIFLDADPDLFKKVLSYLRMRQMVSPAGWLPIPHVSEEQRAEFDLLVKHYGLERFLCTNIFERVAVLSDVHQSLLQSSEVVDVIVGSSEGAKPCEHQKVLGSTGTTGGADIRDSLKIKFLKHRVEVLAMELRAGSVKANKHLSKSWIFRHGNSSIDMGFVFSRDNLSTGRLETAGISGFADEVEWVFPKNFSLEHVVLHGFVVPK